MIIKIISPLRTKYVGKAYSLNFHTGIAKKLVLTATAAMAYDNGVSVSGCVHDFLIVGSDAKTSLTMARIMAIVGWWVSFHRIKAAKEMTPQT